jgi:hypothetical protein
MKSTVRQQNIEFAPGCRPSSFGIRPGVALVNRPARHHPPRCRNAVATRTKGRGYLELPSHSGEYREHSEPRNQP